ncbi:protein kinase domain-containing protein [Citrus sinensis]|nr:protein kinase domain-containing protein [Citrus sinensis]
MSTIQGVGLQNNSLSGSLQSIPYVRLPNLEELYLWGNHFSGSIPNFIFNASKLSRLELQKNSFSGFIPSTFGNLRNLKRLGLNNNHLTSLTLELSFLSSLSNCKYLEFIDLSSNSIDGILSRKSVGNLSHSLKIFDMSDCNVSGSIPEEIGNLTNLIGFYLGGNNLNGSIPITLGKLQKLQVLYFPDNKLEGSIPDEVCRLAKVYQLDLSNNKLSGSIPACFGDLASLRNLSLASNELISVIPSTFWNLKDILYLNLSSNSLTGPLPLEIGNLKVLVKIDFSMNNFSGVIPNAIGGIKDLQFLFLEYNILQGSIPDSFGDLMSLKSLNLSNNNLSGSIPVSLEKLSYLKDLNLSFNKLEGEIPKGGSFGNFSAESFEGNKLLCGSPNLHVPPCKTSIQHTRRKNTILLGIFLPLSTIFMIAVILLIARNRKRGRQQPNDADMPQEATWRRFSYLELCQATDGFSENNLIGRGGFGSVYKARIQDGMEVAVKVFNQQCGRAFKSFDVECEVMKSIRHRNIIKIISCCSIGDFKALVLEYMPHGSLEKFLYSSNCILDIFQRLNIMIDVASALEYLHFGYSVPIIHCDLKPSNVLFDNNMVAHLSDFGIAKLLIGEDQSLTQTQTLATIGYMAPEYGREGRVSTNGDVYSFGIMLIEVFTRKKPTDEIFSGEMTLRCWVNDLLPISVTEVVDANLLSQEDDHFVAKEECMSFVFNLAIKCTVESPEQRINAKEIVTGLSKIRDSLLRNVGAEQKRPQNDVYMPPEATWRRFSYLELCRATNGFSENNLIGRGGIGSLYKARIGDRMEVAVKVFNLQYVRAFSSFNVECEIMKSIRHRNLIKVISSCSNEEFKALALEYMPHGSLEKYLYSSNYILDIFQRLNIMIDVASALEYLYFGYSTPVIHCDLKPSNVLLGDNMVAHLSDFGITKLLTREDQFVTQTQTPATIGYMALEYGSEGRVSTNGDVYNFGVMLMETFTGKKPTNEIFNEGMTLKHWVNDWLLISIMKIVDGSLLSREDIQFVAKEQWLITLCNNSW